MRDRVVSTAVILATDSRSVFAYARVDPYRCDVSARYIEEQPSGASSQEVGTLRRSRACRPGAAPGVTNARLRAQQAPEHHARRLPRILLRFALPLPEADAGARARQRGRRIDREPEQDRLPADRRRQRAPAEPVGRSRTLVVGRR